jgi:hypothetical protein
MRVGRPHTCKWPPKDGLEASRSRCNWQKRLYVLLYTFKMSFRKVWWFLSVFMLLWSRGIFYCSKLLVFFIKVRTFCKNICFVAFKYNQYFSFYFFLSTILIYLIKNESYEIRYSVIKDH